MSKVQNPYLFQTVLTSLIEKFGPVIAEETKCADGSANQGITLAERFETFPRSVYLYSQMIATLASVAAYDVVSVLAFLRQALSQILSGRLLPCRTRTNSRSSKDIMVGFQLVLVTDTVCEIVRGMEEMESQTAKALISAGISICMKPPHSQEFASFLLSQWSVTLSVVSKLAPNILYDCLTQLIINKSDLFFVMVRYLRLDFMKEHSDEMIDTMMVHVRKAKQRKMLNSSMLESLSTMLMSYHGDSKALLDMYNMALAMCEQENPEPGAVELVTTLLPKMKDRTREKIEEFYKNKVFPLAQRKEGMKTAVRALRNLMYGKDVDLDFLFWNWGPSHRENSFDFVRWNGADTARQDSEGSFGWIFMKYYVDSPYFGQCPHLLRDVIVHLAALDFDYFAKDIFGKFSEVFSDSEDNDKFMVFLNTVPMINDPLFAQYLERYRKVSHDQIEMFNDQMAQMADGHLQRIVGRLRSYGFPTEIYGKMRRSLEKYSSAVDELFGSWKISAGAVYDQVIAMESNLFPAQQQQQIRQAAKILRILPYVINSQIFAVKQWTECIIRLASLDNITIAKPAYHICQSLIQNDKRRELVMKGAVKLILNCEHPAIVSTCLRLLLEAIDEMEPETPKSREAFEYDLEFAAFFSLACAHPFVRRLGYDLLAKINKLLQNQGLFSKIESHITAISSNAKHNILLQQFPKRPGRIKCPDEELSMKRTKNSRYQEPWLFFLAEFGRIIVHSAYMPILSRISKMCCQYELKENENDFCLGAMVIFCSTCTIKDNVAEDLYVYDMPVGATGELPEFHNELEEVISKVISRNNIASLNVLVKAMIHSNYTIVPLIISKISEIFKNGRTPDCLPALWMLLSCIEGNLAIRKRVFEELKELVTNVFVNFFLKEQWNVNTFSPKQQNCLTDSTVTDDKFSRAERLVLSYLSCLMQWLDTDNCDAEFGKWNVASRSKTLFFVANWACLDNTLVRCNTIIMYASAALVPILSVGPIFQFETPWAKNYTFVGEIAQCDLRGFKALRPLLENNLQWFLPPFIDACFSQASPIADLFFDAICHVVTQKNEKVRQQQEGDKSKTVIISKTDTNFWTRWAGSLFVLGLFRLKTGSLLAPNFLKAFIPFYAFLIGNTDDQLRQDLATLPIDEIPPKYFQRVAENVVSEALSRMQNRDFKGPVKVLVDIVATWVRLFRMLPKEGVCVPGVAISGPRLTPKQFLQQLLEITESKKNEHDFLRVVEIWTSLLVIPDHRQVVLVYIIEYAEATTRRMLFDELLSKFPKIVVEMLAERCKFAYFAYVSYQTEGDFEKEFWFVPVIMRALKYHMEHCVNDLHKFIHFAMLFHANQTQSLLKRLCKYMDIPYSRRTLSSGSLRKIVTIFEKKLVEKHRVGMSVPPRAISPDIVPHDEDDEPKEPKKDPKSRPSPITRWAKEAIRWAIGCNNIRFAYLSLMILNTLKGYTISPHDQQDLLRGICKSTAYFLSICEPKDQQTYDYIGETFTVFRTHFNGNEEFALKYIRTYLSFVVSVDAYYDQMLRLYLQCVESPKTGKDALKDVLAVLWPSFNELESNSTAYKTFEDFIATLRKMKVTEWDIDLQFVKEALKRAGKGLENDHRLVKSADSDQRNRALQHYSLMVGTASADLKKRIFVLSSLILEQISQERLEARQCTSSIGSYKSPSVGQLQPTSVTDVKNPETVASIKRTEEEDKMEVTVPVADRSDLNKQALVVIFRAAVDMLPQMDQALKFVQNLSRIDPLIVTVPIIDEKEWKESVECVLKELEAYGTQENATVTLTDCKHLGSASNLLNKESRPKILPYNTQHDWLQSIVGNTESTKSAGNWVENIMKTFLVLGRELHRKISDRISPNIVVVAGKWDRIPEPRALIPDDRLASRDEAKDNRVEVDFIVCSSADFLRMPDD